jgi:uncharacterized protein
MPCCFWQKAHINYICILVMKKIELEIVMLSHSVTQKHNYAVILGEVGGLRRLPIIIGGSEAQAIAVAIENIKPSRPITHDLMKNFFDAFEIDLHEVLINDLQEGVFYARLLCSNFKETIEIDSRTSDAIALAVRFGCPIFTYENIMESASIKVEEDKKVKEVPVQDNEIADMDNEDLSRLTLVELNNLLDQVLEKEDYIKAVAIRDEINKRK